MNKFLVIVVALAALFAGMFLFNKFQHQPLEQPQYSLYYQQPRAVKPFKLTVSNGEAFTNKNLQGKWSWVFFGYTSCPDVCPTTLQELNFIYDDLKKVSSKVQVLFVSVDPQRDTQEKLNQYIAYFNKEFIALRAGHEVLFPFARSLGLMYAIVDNNQATAGDNNNESYLVDHSASMVLINPQGKIAAIFKPEIAIGKVPSIDGEKLISDFTKIVALAR